MGIAQIYRTDLNSSPDVLTCGFAESNLHLDPPPSADHQKNVFIPASKRGTAPWSRVLAWRIPASTALAIKRDHPDSPRRATRIIKLVLLQRGGHQNTPDFGSAMNSVNPVTWHFCLTDKREDVQHIEAISKSQATTNSTVL